MIITFAGVIVPAGVIMFLCGRIWDRFEDSPWKEAVQRAGLPDSVPGVTLEDVRAEVLAALWALVD